MSELTRLQQRFYALVTAPEPVSRQPVDPVDLAADFRGDALASSIERLDVYANMYFFRIHDVLAEQYPLLTAALGPQRFHNLVTDYLAQSPPNHPSLRYAGARLASFLARGAHGPAWLAELARLEWAYVDLCDGPDTEVVRTNDVSLLGPEALAELRLALIPTQAVLRASHRVDRIGKAANEPVANPVVILVWRQETGVDHRAVDEIEADLLEWCARTPPTFAEVCEALANKLGEDRATATAFSLLHRWLTDGVIRKTPSDES